MTGGNRQQQLDLCGAEKCGCGKHFFCSATTTPSGLWAGNLPFAPNGWSNFSDAARPLARSALTSALLFSGAGTVAFGLVLFLYLMFRRKELAILRALGCPGRRVVGQAALPLAMMIGIGILCGGLGAYRLGLRKAAEALARLSSEVPLPVHFPPLEANPMLLIPWVVWMLAGFAGLRLLVRRPILSELQAQDGKQAAQRAQATDTLPRRFAAASAQGFSAAPTHAVTSPAKVQDPAFPRSKPSASPEHAGASPGACAGFAGM